MSKHVEILYSIRNKKAHAAAAHMDELLMLLEETLVMCNFLPDQIYTGRFEEMSSYKLAQYINEVLHG